MDNILLYNATYELTPIGTKGFVNLGGVIYEVELNTRRITRNSNPRWANLYNVWVTGDNKKYLTSGRNEIYFNNNFCKIGATIEDAKRNIAGCFGNERFSVTDYLTSKYGIEKNLCCGNIVMYKMVNGKPERYSVMHSMEIDGNGLSFIIPDIENGIAFKTAEECISNHDYGFVGLNDSKKDNHDEEIVVKVGIKKSDLKALKDMGFKFDC